MALTADPQRDVVVRRCDQCGADYRVVTGFVYRDGVAFAVHKSALHHHDGADEAWIDVILGSWSGGGVDDHVTFGCRVGPFGAGGTNACALVPAAAVYSDAPIFGHKLDRDAALAHPALADFWTVVDFLMHEDPDVSRHVPVG
jgi:hypothetical protein